MTDECRIFACFFLFGAAAAAVYDVLRIARRLILRGALCVAVEDGVYWLCAGLSFFFLLSVQNDGQMRVYPVLAVVLGAALYLWGIGRFVLPFLSERIAKIKNWLKIRRKAVMLKLPRFRGRAERNTKDGEEA